MSLLQSVIDHASTADAVDYEDIAATVEALAGSGDVSLVPRLNAALERFLDEGNFYGRDLIVEVLAGVAGVAALPALLLAADRDLGDDQDGLRSEIAGLLHEDLETARELILDLVTGDVPERRRAGLLVLGDVAEADDVELLVNAVGHPDADIRLAAVEALEDWLSEQRVFAVLTGALHDTDEAVRAAAVGLLGTSGRPDAVAALAVVVTDDLARVRGRVAYALGRLGASPELLRLLQDPDRQVRDKALDALGSVGDRVAVDALLAAAAEPDAKLRSQAAKSLAEVADADPRVVPGLMRLARDEDASVRAATLSGIASVKDQYGRWPTLAASLAEDPDSTVRQRVALVVHHLAPEDAAAILGRLTSDPEAVVRQTAEARNALRGSRRT